LLYVLLQSKKLITRQEHNLSSRQPLAIVNTRVQQFMPFNGATVPESRNLGFNLWIDLSICFIAIMLQFYGN
jgi:hypothetical protein